MKPILAILLSLAICGATFACPGGGPCTCPQPGNTTIEGNVESDGVDLDIAVSMVIQSASKMAKDKAMAVNEVGPTVEMTFFGIQNTVRQLQGAGVTENDLQPLVGTAEILKATLNKARPVYMQGIITAQYASMLKEKAGGDPVGLLQAAALFVEAGEKFAVAAELLEGVTDNIEEAKEVANKLYESLGDQ